VMPLHTELHDPLDRLQEIRRGAAKAKAMAGVVGRDLAARLFDVLPDAASELATRRLVLPQMSIVVSNVRGPDVPLFMAGARLVSFAPISIAIDGLGLNVTGFSYHGTLWLCTVACRDMLPDPAFFATCLRESFAALERAAAGTPVVAEPAAVGGRARRSTPSPFENESRKAGRGHAEFCMAKTQRALRLSCGRGTGNLAQRGRSIVVFRILTAVIVEGQD